MAESDGAAVDVDAGGIEVERADDGQGLRGKGFVQLDEVDVVEREAGAAASALGMAVMGPMPISSGRQPVTA